MPDIRFHFPIAAPARRVFDAVSTASGLDAWWTKSSSGVAKKDAEFELGFGAGFDWRARVVKCVVPREFTLELTHADEDWLGTRIRFQLEEEGGATTVRFHHSGWPEANEHYRISSYCWAMYLRLLKRHVEHGETVPYDERLEA